MGRLARSADFWSGLVLAALGTYIVVAARGWTYMGEDGPGPGFFPAWYGGAMVVLSLALAVGAVLKRHLPGASGPFRWSELGRALACWLAFVACIALMPLLGFPIAFGLLTGFVVAVMARQSQRVALAYAVGGSLLFYAIFVLGLDLALPSAKLF